MREVEMRKRHKAVCYELQLGMWEQSEVCGSTP